MQNSNENTVLRTKSILVAKKNETAVTEDQLQAVINVAIAKRSGLAEDRHNQFDDDSKDVEALDQYCQRRAAERKTFAKKTMFGSVREISGEDYVNEVTAAGPGTWVVIHLYAIGVPLCALIHQHMQRLALRYPQTKFLRSIATSCIPNFPDRNLPTVFVYYEGQIKDQFIGWYELRGEKLTADELEYMLGQAGAVPTEIKEDPQPIRDKFHLLLLNRKK